MSLSRALALLIANELDYRGAIRALAFQLTRDHPETTVDSFEAYLRARVFRPWHRGGMSKEDLRRLRRIAREEFHKLKGTGTVSSAEA